MTLTSTITMRDGTLTEHGRKVRDAVREIIPLLRDHAKESEDLGEIPQTALKAADDAGVFKLSLPIERGGAACGSRDSTEVIYEIAKGDPALAWIVMVALGRTREAGSYDIQMVEELYGEADSWVGPLIAGGSPDGKHPALATKVEGGWAVEGRWAFTSGSKHAAWFTVFVPFVDGDVQGMGEVSLHRDQVEILDDWKVMGLTGTASNSIKVKAGVIVPEHRFFNVFDKPAMVEAARGRWQGLGFTHGIRGQMMNIGLANAAIAVGMAETVIEEMATQSKRRPSNLPYPTMAESGHFQVTAGRARAMVDIAKLTIFGAADENDAKALEGSDFDQLEDTRLNAACSYAIRMATDAIDMIQLALGSSTVSLKNPVQRAARDARVLATHGAIRMEPLLEMSGRIVVGVDPIPTLAGGLALFFGGAPTPEKAPAPNGAPGAPGVPPAGGPGFPPPGAPAGVPVRQP